MGAETAKLLSVFGAGEWTRTIDLLITNQLLYQLSYAGPHIRAHNLHGFFLSLKGFFVQQQTMDERQDSLRPTHWLTDQPGGTGRYLNRTTGCSLTEAPWPGPGRQRGFCSLPYCSRAILSTCHLV